MSQPAKTYETFKHGATWLRADFHLHPRADKEFYYSGPDNEFIKQYVEGLKSQNIQVGVITNHNKFDLDEFKALRKAARREEILLLPGVELSVGDGANGVHVLIVFSEQWLEQGKNYIDGFIGSMFIGKDKAEYEQENGKSDQSILQVVGALDKFNKDYFLVFAHVGQRSGLWYEMGGGRLKDLDHGEAYQAVRDRTLGFQKVKDIPPSEKRTDVSRTKVKQWLTNWYPAEVEGSDCKSIGQIGKGSQSWLKIGDFTFEAIKYALTDYAKRVRSEKPPEPKHAYIHSISFEGGALHNQSLYFSSELNTLIGIRGSGKSSILEVIRYLLDLPFGVKSSDQNYKSELVAHTLKSGGKAILTLIDKHGKACQNSRILNEKAEVYYGNELQPGVIARQSIINPIYFGQKDLADTGEGFESDLVEKLMGDKLAEIRRQIDEQKKEVIRKCQQFLGLSETEEKLKAYKQKLQDTEFKLKTYEDHQIQDKLQAQVNFEKDHTKIKKILESLLTFQEDMSALLDRHEDELKNHLVYQSKENATFFDDFLQKYQGTLQSFAQLQAVRDQLKTGQEVLAQKESEFIALKQSQAERFAQIRRTLEADLKDEGNTINVEVFPLLQKTRETTQQMVDALQQELNKHHTLQTELLKAIAELNHLWHQEFQAIEAELQKINERNRSLKISGEFKGDKAAFLSFFKSTLKGSRVRESSLEELTKDYTDFGAIYQDMESALKTVGTLSEGFQRYFEENLAALLTWQVPNQFKVKYKEKELKHHSLGQRASALMLFILSQREHDLIMIDQPEDDLDNQTLYEDVIKLIQEIKPTTQFIFATHNPNIPILGDAEQIYACEYSDAEIALKHGSIDSPTIQQEIVDIMEGGEDAFNRRKEIYKIWKPQKSSK